MKAKIQLSQEAHKARDENADTHIRKDKKHSQYAHRHHTNIFYFQGSAGVFGKKRQNIHAYKGNLKPTAPTGKQRCEHHMSNHFKIYCHSIELQPLLIHNEEHNNIKANTEHIKLSHGRNTALNKNHDHKYMYQ